MCHTVVAQRMCQVCQRSQGELVIDFTRCARKCSSPFYCLTPKPQMEVCALCAAKLPTPVLARQVAEDMAAGRMIPGRPLSSCPSAQAVTDRRPEVGRPAIRCSPGLAPAANMSAVEGPSWLQGEAGR